MRTILFRAISERTKRFVYGIYFNADTGHTIIENGGSDVSDFHFVDPETVGQFTGLTDKNGVKIFYNGQELRIKGKMGDNDEYSYDCIFKTNEIRHDGLSISFDRLYNELPDSKDNSFPINSTMTFRRGELGEKDGKLIVADDYAENHMSRQRWKTHSKTMDIEVIETIND